MNQIDKAYTAMLLGLLGVALIFLLVACSIPYVGLSRFAGNWRTVSGELLYVVDERSNDSVVLFYKDLLAKDGLSPGSLRLNTLMITAPFTNREVRAACKDLGLYIAWNRPEYWMFACRKHRGI